MISESGLRQTPPLYIAPAKILFSQIARAKTDFFVKPEFMSVQLEPLSVDRKTPPSVPAKILIPLTAKQ
jgi:hypothetical protein